MSNSDTRQYVRDMLSYNPAYDFDSILRRRDEFFGTTPTDTFSQLDSIKRRQAAEEDLQQIRRRFWESTADEILEKLNLLPADELPDIQVAADRLRKVAEIKQQIDRLAQHPNSRPMMLSALKRIIVVPPRYAGSFREQILRSLMASDNLVGYQKMVAMIRNDFPQIYDLEPDWLATIERRQKRSRSHGIEIVVMAVVCVVLLILWVSGWLI